MPKLFIETLGCAMNVRDSEHIVAQLIHKQNYELTQNKKEADLIIINTCSVREKPVSKLFSEIGSFNKIKKQNTKIGVVGCTASHLGKEIIKRAPFVDFVLGARNTSKIIKALNTSKFVQTDIKNDDSNYSFEDFRFSNSKANINITIGCDKECSYCIVPFTRGDEISIPSNLILNEVKKAIKNGLSEIVLLGQNVNNYGKRFSAHKENINFSKLLNLVSEIDGVKRISFTSPHPLHIDDEFIDTFANNPKIIKHIHLPLQSGSTKILKAMKRGYTKEWFLKKAFKLREKVSECTIGTDIIVAFPAETDQDYQETLDVMKQVRFEQIFSFKYSPRPLTKAATLSDSFIKESVADERLWNLQKLYKEIQQQNLQQQIGKTYKVFFDDLKPDKKILGKCNNYFTVLVEGSEELLNQQKKVKITHIEKGSLIGEII